MPGFMAINALKKSILAEILVNFRPPEVPFTAVYLDRRLVSPWIQAFIDFMVERGNFWDK